jgi:hypothetical protein
MVILLALQSDLRLAAVHKPFGARDVTRIEWVTQIYDRLAQ